jgi:hypothetical protein
VDGYTSTTGGKVYKPSNKIDFGEQNMKVQTYIETFVNLVRQEANIKHSKKKNSYTIYLNKVVVIRTEPKYVTIQVGETSFRIPKKYVNSIIGTRIAALMYTYREDGKSTLMLLQEPCKLVLYNDRGKLVIGAYKYRVRKK